MEYSFPLYCFNLQLLLFIVVNKISIYLSTCSMLYAEVVN